MGRHGRNMESVAWFNWFCTSNFSTINFVELLDDGIQNTSTCNSTQTEFFDKILECRELLIQKVLFFSRVIPFWVSSSVLWETLKSLQGPSPNIFFMAMTFQVFCRNFDLKWKRIFFGRQHCLRNGTDHVR